MALPQVSRPFFPFPTQPCLPAIGRTLMSLLQVFSFFSPRRFPRKLGRATLNLSNSARVAPTSAPPLLPLASSQPQFSRLPLSFEHKRELGYARFNPLTLLHPSGAQHSRNIPLSLPCSCPLVARSNADTHASLRSPLPHLLRLCAQRPRNLSEKVLIFLLPPCPLATLASPRHPLLSSHPCPHSTLLTLSSPPTRSALATCPRRFSSPTLSPPCPVVTLATPQHTLHSPNLSPASVRSALVTYLPFFPAPVSWSY
jgi:hypothetical protein